MQNDQTTPKTTDPLDSDEVTATLMALTTFIEDSQKVLSNPGIPFSPEARRDIKKYMDAGKSAKVKMEAVSMGGEEFTLPPAEDVDLNNLMTKES